MGRFILIKKKTTGKLIGAVPIKKGATKKKIRATIKNKLRKGLSARIVTLSELKNVLKRNIPFKKKGGKK